MDPHDPAVEQLDDTQISEPEAQNGAARGALIDALVARRQRHAAERHLDLPVPGYEGQLVLRLGPIAGQALNRISEKAQGSKSPERTFNANADTLIAATREVLGSKEPGGRLVTLPDEEGEPVRLDLRLARLLQLPGEPQRARAVVLALFGMANSPELAVAVAATEYAEWAASANDELDEELLGES
jgi:hypothetical protein